MQHKGAAALLSPKDSHGKSWNRHNLLASKRGNLPPTPLYNIPGGRQRQTHLCMSPSFGKCGKGDILLPVFPWGVLVNLTEDPLWLFIMPLKHSLNTRMLANQAAFPATPQARPFPFTPSEARPSSLTLAAIHAAIRWKIKTAVPAVPFHHHNHLCFSFSVPSLHHVGPWCLRGASRF